MTGWTQYLLRLGSQAGYRSMARSVPLIAMTRDPGRMEPCTTRRGSVVADVAVASRAYNGSAAAETAAVRGKYGFRVLSGYAFVFANPLRGAAGGGLDVVLDGRFVGG